MRIAHRLGADAVALPEVAVGPQVEEAVLRLPISLYQQAASGGSFRGAGTQPPQTSSTFAIEPGWYV